MKNTRSLQPCTSHVRIFLYILSLSLKGTTQGDDDDDGDDVDDDRRISSILISPKVLQFLLLTGV
jgi:hypothetical protein